VSNKIHTEKWNIIYPNFLLCKSYGLRGRQTKRNESARIVTQRLHELYRKQIFVCKNQFVYLVNEHQRRRSIAKSERPMHN
jgi:hypothetical protein